MRAEGLTLSPLARALLAKRRGGRRALRDRKSGVSYRTRHRYLADLRRAQGPEAAWLAAWQKRAVE
jgi:hypothetical protein